jgi:hypothetical protein
MPQAGAQRLPTIRKRRAEPLAFSSNSCDNRLCRIS